MVINKRFFLRFFMGLECFIFLGIYFLGSQGLKKIWHENAENKKIATLIKKRENELDELKNEIIKWEKNPFYKEQWAREKLQMARINDEVYVITQ